MKITIKGTNIKLSESVYNYIYKKINDLERFTQNMGGDYRGGQPTVECWVEVERVLRGDRSGDVFRAEAQIRLPGVSGVRAESRQWDLHQAIDEAKDEMQRQLKRYKRKQSAKREREARKIKRLTRYSESI